MSAARVLGSRRATATPVVTAALLLAACSSPYYAQFEAMPADGRGERVERPTFSIVVPERWQLRAGDAAALSAFEDPPANGQNRLFRTLAVTPAAAVAGDDPEQLVAASLQVLQQRHARDGLEVRETGSAELADRDCAFLRGRIDGPAAGWSLEILEYLVPGDGGSLLVAFSVPEGQMGTSQQGFAATAATLHTSLQAPKDPAGPMRWLDGQRFYVRLPEDWQQQEAAGFVATFALGGSSARCEVSTVVAAAGHDLDRIARSYAQEHAAAQPDLRILAVERTQRAGHQWLRIRSAWRDQGGTAITDDVFATSGDRLDRMTFAMSCDDYRAHRALLDRSGASMRWR
jgi:hypothetical protein